MTTLQEIVEEGMVLKKIDCPESLIHYIKTLSPEKEFDNWSIMDGADFPEEIKNMVIAQLGEGLEEYKENLKVKIDEWRKGHSLVPHSDMTLYSPFVAQLFVILPETEGETLIGCDVIFGKEKEHEYVRRQIETGTLAFFYTHPNSFVTAFTKINSNHKVYVINFVTSFDESSCGITSWIPKDVQMPEWGPDILD
jgi:hypothetical protein